LDPKNKRNFVITNLEKSRNILAIISVISVLCTFLILIVLLNQNEKIILIPTLSDKTTLSSTHVDHHYLERLTRDVSNLVLNISPGSGEYVAKELMPIIDPSRYPEIQRKLGGYMKSVKKRRVTTIFFPNNIEVNTKELTSKISGTVKNYVNNRIVKTSEKTFVMHWLLRGSRVYLTGFEEKEGLQND
jgi:conjugal transfer pilus assembly protein TraE